MLFREIEVSQKNSKRKVKSSSFVGLKVCEQKFLLFIVSFSVVLTFLNQVHVWFWEKWSKLLSLLLFYTWAPFVSFTALIPTCNYISYVCDDLVHFSSIRLQVPWGQEQPVFFTILYPVPGTEGGPEIWVSPYISPWEYIQRPLQTSSLGPASSWYGKCSVVESQWPPKGKEQVWVLEEKGSIAK